MEDAWLTELYFDILRSECFSDAVERREYEGVLRALHNIPFMWTIWSDENRAGDALQYRQQDFLGVQAALGQLDQAWLNKWAIASPSVLEVLLGMARRWNYYFEMPVSYYFGIMFLNMKFDHFPGRVLPAAAHERLRVMCDDWMTRQFDPNGTGSPFPLGARHTVIGENGQKVNMRELDIWAQMNAYSAIHFQ